MKPRKIFEKIAYISIGLSILVIIGLTVFQQLQIRKFSQGIDSEAPIDIGSAGGSGPVADQSVQEQDQDLYSRNTVKNTDNIEMSDLNTLLNETEKELDTAHERFSEEIEKNAEKAKNQREFYSRMTESPSFKTGIRESMKSTNEILYGPLFEDLNLSPDKLEKFKDLLADYQADIIVISQGTLSVSSEEERTELQKHHDDAEKEYKTIFNELLGNADYAEYQAYQDRLNERYIINMFTESLGPDERLTEDQQQDLIDSLYREREDVFSELNYDQNKLEPIIFMNDDTIARRMMATEEIHSRALENARGFLSASQHEKLESYLKQQRDIEEESLKLAVEQFGGTTKQE